MGMNILLLMIPLSLLFVVAAALLFFWAVDNDQFSDLDNPSVLPLADDLEPPLIELPVKPD